jgi:hypothetical protein
MCIFIIATSLLPLVLSSCNDKSVYRELQREEIEPIFMRLTGHELPDKVTDLRAIRLAQGGFEHLYIAFMTNQEGYECILDVFGRQGAQIEEFPRDKNRPYEWDMSGFLTGCNIQEDLGVNLFNEELIRQIKKNDLVKITTGHYPEDAVKGYYLAGACSKSVFYCVLIFKEQKYVYLYIAHNPPGKRMPR